MGKSGLPEAEAFVFAHLAGDGDLLHLVSADGAHEHFLTGGADCVVQLRAADTLAAVGEASGVGHHDAGVTALAAARGCARFATGCEDGQVRLFSYPAAELQAIATRFTLPVRALAFSADGALLAAGGDEDAIRVLDVSGEECTVRHTLQGTFRAVRSLAFDPKGELLVSSHEDGTVLVWDAAAGTLSRDLGKVAPSVARADWHAYNRVAWAPDGSRLAVPGRNNDVTLFSRDDDFAEAARLKDAHLGDVSLLAISPNGLYCATAGMDLQVVVWELRKCVAVATSKLPEPATGLAWRATADANALAVLTHEGTAAVWDAPVSSRLPPPAKPLEDVDMSEFEAPTAGGFVDDSAVDDATGDGDAADGDDDDGDDVSSGGDGSDSEPGGEGGKKKGSRHERIVVMPAPPAPRAQPQGAIAPGATPAMGAPPRRFLAYNTLGCVTCRDDGPVQHIETHFHDLERPGPRVPSHTDYLGVNLGALGPAGVACASPEKGETAATLMFRPFEGWSANAEWTLPFAAGEEAVALAAGGSFVAAATSARLVRVITPMGVQQAVFALDGAPVALAAHGSLLACVWHSALPVGPPPGEQRLAFAVYDTDSGAQTAAGALPLTPGEHVAWLGFSEDGLLAAADSAGVLRLRTGEFGGAWVPVFSAAAVRSSDAERHWVVGLSGAEVYAVVCKAPDLAPAVQPRPVLSLFPLAVPVLGAAAGSAGSAAAPALEEALLRARMWAGDAARAHGPGSQPALTAELELNKALLKLFNAALKGDRLGRAAELAAHMTHASCLDGALKMANAARAVSLAERITGIIHGRQAMEVEMGGDELAAEYPSQALAGVAPRATPAQAPAAKFARRPAPASPAKAAARGDENDSPPARKREAKPAAEAPAPKRAAAAGGAPAANPFARK